MNLEKILTPNRCDNLTSFKDDIFLEVAKQREKILEAFIAETGYKPSEIEQIVEYGPNTTKWFIQKR